MPRRPANDDARSLASSQFRIVELLCILLDEKFPIPLTRFHDDQEKWGTPRTFHRTRAALNQAWNTLNRGDLFLLCDDNGVPQPNTGRYLRLADKRLTSSSAERMAVLPAFLQLLSVFKGTILSETYDSLYKGWLKDLTAKEREAFNRNIKKFFYFDRGLKDYAKQQDVLDAVYDALVREEWLEIVADSKAGKGTKSKVRPLTLVMFHSGLYLVCLYDNQKDSEAPYKFRLESIKSAKRLRSDHFKYPVSYSPERLFNGAFGFVTNRKEQPARVVLEFSEKSWVYPYLKERQWSPNDVYKPAGNGRMQLIFPVNNLDECLSWTLGFGAELVIVEPTVLRRKAAEAVKRLSEAYLG